MKRDQHSLLVAAADLLERTRWTQESIARLADGTKCDSYNPDAAQFCALGAFERAASDGHYATDTINSAFCALRDAVGPIPEWNDALPKRTGKSTVIAALRKAAKL